MKRTFALTLLLSSLPLFAGSAAVPKKDLVEVAAGAGSFKTLAAALGAADLVTTLKSEGPFTVFAPTDEAFARLPEGTVAKLLLPENRDALKAILTYHVVAGRVSAADVAKRTSASTVSGERLTISARDGRVKVGAATVVQADVAASNGIIHVIDTVLLPPGLKL